MLVTKKRHKHITQLWEDQLTQQIEITKYWQAKYKEALGSQEVLNAMLKEATREPSSFDIKDVYCKSCGSSAVVASERAEK